MNNIILFFLSILKLHKTCLINNCYLYIKSNKMTKLIKALLSLIFSIFFLNINAGNSRYRIIIRDNPSTDIDIAWDQTSGSNPILYYDIVDHGTNWASYSHQKTPDRIVSYRDMNNHFARLNSLSPGTVYYFLIKDSEGVSRRLSFKTISNNSNDTLSIIAGGDSRTDAPAWIPTYGDLTCRPNRQNANILVSKIRPDFIIFGGDFVLNLDLVVWTSDANQEWKDWFDDWQLTISSDGRMYPILTSEGNHEDADDLFNLFDTYGQGTYYAHNFGGDLLRLYSLNCEISITGAQTNWLENDLTLNSDKIWRFAQYHNPIRPHNSGKDEGVDTYNYWVPLFQSKKVQLAIESDAHTSKTTWPIIPCTSGIGCDEGFVRNDDLGTVYIGEGTWGAPMRDADDNKQWTRAYEKVGLFFWIKVSKYKTEIRGIKYDNASQVPEHNDANRLYLMPELSLWTPSNGNLIIIPNRNLSSEKEILNFQFPNQVGTAQINSSAGIIFANITNGSSLNGIIPTIDISPRSTISPLSNIAQNFTNNVTYLVTAENLSTKQWRIFITEEYTVSAKNDILSFQFNEEVAPSEIDTISHSISSMVAAGSNLSSLTPQIIVSPNATILPWSNLPQDFSSGFVYKVTAQNGIYRNWTVYVQEDIYYNISNQNDKHSQIKVFPNPASEIAIIQLASTLPYRKLIISDVFGKIIKEIEVINQNRILINTSEFKKGIYFISSTNNKYRESCKFAVQ